MGKRIAIVVTGAMFLLWILTSIKIIGTLLLVTGSFVLLFLAAIILAAIFEWMAYGFLEDYSPVRWAYIKARPTINKAIEAYIKWQKD